MPGDHHLDDHGVDHQDCLDDNLNENEEAYFPASQKCFLEINVGPNSCQNYFDEEKKTENTLGFTRVQRLRRGVFVGVLWWCTCT